MATASRPVLRLKKAPAAAPAPAALPYIQPEQYYRRQTARALELLLANVELAALTKKRAATLLRDLEGVRCKRPANPS